MLETVAMKGSGALLLVALTLLCICGKSRPSLLLALPRDRNPGIRWTTPLYITDPNRKMQGNLLIPVPSHPNLT